MRERAGRVLKREAAVLLKQLMNYIGWKLALCIRMEADRVLIRVEH